MGTVTGVVSKLGGRRSLVALGGLYVGLAAGWPLLMPETPPLPHVQLLGILVGGSGLVLLATGYWLPRTEIRADLFATVSRWCFGSIGVMIGILVFVEAVTGLRSIVENVLILTSLAGVAGLGMGFHDARAKTRARNAEEQRREAERYGRELERYEAIVETVDDGIHVLDEDDRFALVNDAYAELVGYDREELLGSHTSVVAEDAATLADEIRRDLRADGSESKTYEATLETASGERIEAEATMAFLPDPEGTGRDRVAVVRDVTERNERQQRLERQNERLDSFASMLAHELRNPVTIGQIYSQQLPDEADSEAVEYVTEAFDRIEDMIDVMLVLTRGHEAVGGCTPIRLADAAEAAWEQVDAPEATLDVRVEGTIEANETYVRHLFRNLFENAVEHGGVDVAITVGDLSTVSASEASGGSEGEQSESSGVSSERREDEARREAKRTGGGFYVADDGVGIPAAERDAVFETGYTTVGEHGGTGLGLAFVEELVDVYGWTCTVTESEAGGAQFEFTDVRTA